jgi:hypothetical protein
MIIISPYLIWEHFNHWPTLEYWANYGNAKAYHYSIFEYLVNILLTMNPLLIPVLIFGLYRIFRHFEEMNYTFFGIMFLVTFGLVFIMHQRVFMLVALIIPLIAAGSIFIEERITRFGRKKGLQAGIVAYLLIGAILVIPASVPILPVKLLPAYAKSFGFLYQPVKDFNSPKSAYPQEFSNRMGWDELVQTVAKVYNSLAPEERKKCGIFADWYGPAGAVDLYGPKYGLPHAVSGHLNYHLWGPGEYTWEAMIVVTQSITAFGPIFEDVKQAAIFKNKYTMPYNNNVPIYICRKAKFPIKGAWKNIKYYQ